MYSQTFQKVALQKQNKKKLTTNLVGKWGCHKRHTVSDNKKYITSHFLNYKSQLFLISSKFENLDETKNFLGK